MPSARSTSWSRTPASRRASSRCTRSTSGYWQRILDTDLNGVFYTIHAALPILRAQGSGVILSISSIAADACGANGGPYVAAKAAVNALTHGGCAGEREPAASART